MGKRYGCAVFSMLFLYAAMGMIPLWGQTSVSPTKDFLATLRNGEPKHYIRPCVYYNFYGTPQRSTYTKKLGRYHFTQNNLGFYLPIFTKDFYSKDSLRISNLHILITANVMRVSPRFTELPLASITKTGIGIRAFYNSGSRNVFFYDLSPFAAEDHYTRKNPTFRYSATLVFNRTVSKEFSWRVGATRTFALGNIDWLPFFGLRFGELDKTYLSIQFPKSVSLNTRFNKYVSGSAYIKLIGGLYSLKNIDTLYNGKDSSIMMGRKELINGIRLDVSPNPNLSFFISSGFTTGSMLYFYSRSFNTAQNSLQPTLAPFKEKQLLGTIYLQFGLSYRFGKAKRVYNNYTMYDVFDMNNTMDPGDNNMGPGNQNIPNRGDLNDLRKIQLKDVEDLIRADDLY
jgi:hypothetical protein